MIGRRRSTEQPQTKAPDELLSELWEMRDQLRSNHALSPQERHAMGNTLEDVANYVGRQVQQPSATNTLLGFAAVHSKAQKLSDDEQRAQQSLIDFVVDNFDKEENHLRAIQLGGYAAFFGLWSITSSMLNPIVSALAALLMLFSAAVFSIWVIFRASILSLCLKKTAGQGLNSLEEFIRHRDWAVGNQQTLILRLTRRRWIAWLASITPAAASVLLLMANLVYIILYPIF